MGSIEAPIHMLHPIGYAEGLLASDRKASQPVLTFGSRGACASLSETKSLAFPSSVVSPIRIPPLRYQSQHLFRLFFPERQEEQQINGGVDVSTACGG